MDVLQELKSFTKVSNDVYLVRVSILMASNRGSYVTKPGEPLRRARSAKMLEARPFLIRED